MLSLLLTSAFAATLTVDPLDGSSYTTIQAAIDEAVDGDTIEVARGSFSECLDSGGKSLTLTGHGSGDGTTIDGSTTCAAGQATITLDAGETWSLQDLVVTRGDHRSFDVLNGAVLDLLNVTVSDNTATDCGGGLYASASTLNITNSTFENLSAGDGGAICAVASSLTVSSSAFTDNEAGALDEGGAIAIYLDDTSQIALIRDSSFSGNTAYSGGAIYASEDDPKDTGDSRLTVARCTFTDAAGDVGVALTADTLDEVALTENTFAGNTALTTGVVFLTNISEVSGTGNLFCGNTGGSTGYSGSLVTDEVARETWSRNVFQEDTNDEAHGGVSVRLGADSSFINNTFVSHRTSDDALPAFLAHESAVVFRNNIVAFSEGPGVSLDAYSDKLSAVTYNAFHENTGGDAGGDASFDPSVDGNIVADPRFNDYSRDGDCTNDDLTLSIESALVDAGDPEDRDDDGTVADIGAYGETITDTDEDGYDNTVDCDDDDPDANPEGVEVAYDGVDQDCDGADLVDLDGDGHASTEAGGTDCDDYDTAIFFGAADPAYDGLDQDCAGDNDYDRDGDGYVGEGYEDEVGGTAPDTGDCDDTSSAVHPDASDPWYDGVDSDCAGDNDYDQDGDGYTSLTYGGDDCDDADPSAYPGAPDEPYDGVFSDCERADEFDVDGDGFDAEVVGGTDCDDDDSDINPDAEDIAYDGVDQDCSGADLTDVDRDGHDAEAVGGDDCDDDDGDISPSETELPDDDIDQDCDGADLVSEAPEEEAPEEEKGCASAPAPTALWPLGLIGLIGWRREQRARIPHTVPTLPSTQRDRSAPPER